MKDQADALLRERKKNKKAQTFFLEKMKNYGSVLVNKNTAQWFMKTMKVIKTIND